MPGPELPSTNAQTTVEGGSAFWPIRRAHLKIGWWMLLAFLTGGIVLEAMHGFKIGWYLDVDRETTRWMWTMTHATGAILGLVHIAFALSLGRARAQKAPSVRLASACLNSASIFIPAAIFLGGILPNGQSLSFAILLAPVGVMLFAAAVVLTAHSLREKRPSAKSKKNRLRSQKLSATEGGEGH